MSRSPLQHPAFEAVVSSLGCFQKDCRDQTGPRCCCSPLQSPAHGDDKSPLQTALRTQAAAAAAEVTPLAALCHLPFNAIHHARAGLAIAAECGVLSCVLMLQPWEALCTTGWGGPEDITRACREGLEPCRERRDMLIAGETHWPHCTPLLLLASFSALCN